MRTILISLLLLAAAGSAAAQAPRIDDRGDALMLTNDLVSVTFLDGRPSLRLAAATDLAAEAAYDHRFTQLVEYRDVDGDGAPSESEVVARLRLADAEGWTVERVETDDRATLNFTLAAPVELAPLVGQNLTVSERVANVSLAFTLRQGAQLEHRLHVEGWPFLSGDHRLALEAVALGEATLDEAEGAVNATLATNGTARGLASWATNATGTLANGSAVDVPVETAVALHGEGESRIVHTYDAAGLAALSHDGTLALPGLPATLESSEGSPLNAVPAPGALLALVATAGAALALRRR